jgi:hypothetical protein
MFPGRRRRGRLDRPREITNAKARPLAGAGLKHVRSDAAIS